MTTPDLHPGAVAPHRERGDDTLRRLGVDPHRGLDTDEVARRQAHHGPNALAPTPRTPGWQRFLNQFRDLLILILVAAAVVSFVVSGELKTPAVVLVVVLLNAVIGFVQENRAEASLDALREMLVTQARVRRGGEVLDVPAEALVPGDIVLLEAGDRVPADGRLLEAVQLELEESALTGESVPSVKALDAIDEDDVPLGDRLDMAFMNTTVTRGRGLIVVTGTGADSEIGRIAGLLGDSGVEKTPLQHQLDGLAHSLAKLAGVIVALVVLIGVLRGQALSDLMLTAVALAVATIPEGLPAVTAVTLAIGVSKMAHQNAIVKRLAGVETLGCTSVICTDKTGTLTLNQMTAREVVVADRGHEVRGEGYVPEGAIAGTADGVVHGGGDEALAHALQAMALCSDATIRRDDAGTWELVGDPTEGALVVLAAKAGVEVAQVRTAAPRLAEVPFDSATKFMATVHEIPGAGVRVYVKGALDVLLDRATRAVGPGGQAVPVAQVRASMEAHNVRMAGRGLRVLAVAQRDLTEEEWAGLGEDDLAADLLVLALVGIMDPPRPEAAHAIAEAKDAGIDVKMITGDHATTAAAIGADLGLGSGGGDGERADVVAVTGADLDRMDDDALRTRLAEISVFARVSPEHKLRLVSALQASGQVVSMTGDGVNDAPALKQADIGVAMGITGTEVAKEAATMVLTDDNFATIVRAVRQGRAIYDNIVSFVRFQLSTTLGFAALFLAAAVFGIADGKPFTAIAILWVNIIMDGPPAMALGVDRGDADLMARSPRPRDERILTRGRWGTIALSAVVMAIGTLAVLVLAPGAEAEAETATVASTMAFNTFVLFQFFNILNARSDRLSVFRRQTFSNQWLWLSLGTVLLLQVGVTHVGFMQSLFDTTAISGAQWLVCVAVASSVLWLEELRKVVVRRS